MQICRFYENEFPSVSDLVVVNIMNINTFGATVKLLEYNLQGFVPIQELQKNRKVGENTVIYVSNLNPLVGSEILVHEYDKERISARFKKSLQVHGILFRLAEKSGMDLEQIYIRLGWPLYRKYGHAIEGLKLLVENKDALDNHIEYREMKNCLVELVRQRL